MRNYQMTKYKFLDVDIETLDTDIDVIADMLPKVGREKWRKRNKHLATKPIPKEVFPTLANLMIEDNIRFVLHEEGYQWYHGEYKITTTAIREVWGLTEHQWRRFQRYVYNHWPV